MTIPVAEDTRRIIFASLTLQGSVGYVSFDIVFLHRVLLNQIVSKPRITRRFMMHFVLVLFVCVVQGIAMASGMSHHAQQSHAHRALPVDSDQRQAVVFPEKTYDETLASMRAHLRAIDAVIAATATGEFSDAASAAEKGLGIGHQHGVDGLQSGHAFMPPEMLTYGSAMHMNARQLVVTLRDAEVTGDIPAVLGALQTVTQQCVACHDAFKLTRGD